jgi:protoheme IX farnesyltransferase
MWLKRRTPQNIVIGGGAGAIPPMIGWAAVTGEVSWAAVIMFAIVFFWTPPHFWPLVIVKNKDYVRAGIPMLPVVQGQRTTKKQCMMYTIVLLLTSISLYFTGVLGVLYLAAAIICSLAFMYFQIRMWFEQETDTVWARKTYFASLAYLPILFTFMVIDSLI